MCQIFWATLYVYTYFAHILASSTITDDATN